MTVPATSTAANSVVVARRRATAAVSGQEAFPLRPPLCLLLASEAIRISQYEEWLRRRHSIAARERLSKWR